LLQEERDALQICQQVEERIEENAEIKRRQDFLLNESLEPGMSGHAGGQRYHMSFNEEVDEATKAHLQEVANSKFMKLLQSSHLTIVFLVLMQDAYRLGLDQPSSYTVSVRPTNLRTPTKRRTSSGISASEFQELMDMSDTDLREIGEELIQVSRQSSQITKFPNHKTPDANFIF
jgi:hypothetical protein